MKSNWDTRKPYNGIAKSLVIALDIGTTFSGVSYAILEPGEIPKIHGVTRFPGQEHVAGNSKIPTILYYNKHGSVVAAGAEAESASMDAQAEEEGWTKAELFKLRLRPKSMKLEMNGMRLGHLPRGKTAVDLFGDFLGYLFRCTRVFIIDTHANGPALWKAVEKDIQFVLSHPNGWEGSQQSKMRRAAIHAGLIPNTDEGKARVRFVTEGEASLHACVLNGLAADVLSNPSGHGFLVADAGGGTLDISSYAIRGVSPLVIEEVAPPDCIFAGSVFVSRRARALFEEKLKSSPYGSSTSVDHIAKRFDETTKRLFRDKKDMQFVSFGSPLDNDLPAGIKHGQLKLTGKEVAELFEPSIKAAIASIKSQIEGSKGVVKSVWLVGGFAASPWLFSQLQTRLAPLNVTVSRPDSQTSKAVADGAIGFYCDHHVSARMSKYMYGVEFLREYDATDEDHIARQHRLFELPSGPKLLPDAFDCILTRGVKVKESTTFSRKYCTELTSLSTLSVFEVEVWCYRGMETPKWILRNKEDFNTLCFVRADLSPLSGTAQPKSGKGGKTYWTIVFSIEIHFGLTEFKARIKWNDNGKIKYGPASIVFNESGTKEEEEEPEGSVDDQQSRSAHHSRSNSRAPSVSGSPRTRSPSYTPEGQMYPDVSNRNPKSVPTTAAPPVAPVLEERKKSSTSRSTSFQSQTSAPHRSSSNPSSHVYPSSQFHSHPATPTTSTPYPADRAVPGPVASTFRTESTSTVSFSSSRGIPTHSRTTSTTIPAVSPPNVVFPSEPTPTASPGPGSRRPSTSSRSGSGFPEPFTTPEVSESRKASILARSGYADPAVPVVESRKSSFSRGSYVTPANATGNPPSPSVVPRVAELPPAITVTEAPRNKSRNVSSASTAAPSIPVLSTLVEKGKSKATTASNSAATTNATPTPLTRSAKSSLISRSNSGQTQLGDTLNGVWGASKSVTPSATASPAMWKGGKPLDPPSAAVAELQKELASGAPPVVGDSERSLETILEPPTVVTPVRTRTGSYASRNGDPVALEQKLAVRFEESQEEQQNFNAEQPLSPLDQQPEPVILRDLLLEQPLQSSIPGGFADSEFDILSGPTEPEPAHEPEPEPLAPIAPVIITTKKGKKGKGSKNTSSAPTPIEFTAPGAPWGQDNIGSEGKGKMDDSTARSALVSAAGASKKKADDFKDLSSVSTPIELTAPATPWGFQDNMESKGKGKTNDSTSHNAPGSAANPSKKKADSSKDLSSVSTPIEPTTPATPWGFQNNMESKGKGKTGDSTSRNAPGLAVNPSKKKADGSKDLSSVSTPIEPTAPAGPWESQEKSKFDNKFTTPNAPAPASTTEPLGDDPVPAAAKKKGDASKDISSASTPIETATSVPWGAQTKTKTNEWNDNSTSRSTLVLTPSVQTPHNDLVPAAAKKKQGSRDVSSVSMPVEVTTPAPWGVQRKTKSNEWSENYTARGAPAEVPIMEKPRDASTLTPIAEPPLRPPTVVEPQPQTANQLRDRKLDNRREAQKDDRANSFLSDSNSRKETKPTEKPKESSGGGWGSWGSSLLGSVAKEVLGGGLKSPSPQLVVAESARVEPKIQPKIEEPKTQPEDVNVPTSRPSGWGMSTKPVATGGGGAPNSLFGIHKVDATTPIVPPTAGWGAGTSKLKVTQPIATSGWGNPTGGSTFGSTNTSSFGAAAKQVGSGWGTTGTSWGIAAPFDSANIVEEQQSVQTPVEEAPQSAVDDIKQVPEPRRVGVVKAEEPVKVEEPKVEEEEVVEEDFGGWGASWGETTKKKGAKGKKGSKGATPVEHVEDEATEVTEVEAKEAAAAEKAEERNKQEEAAAEEAKAEEDLDGWADFTAPKKGKKGGAPIELTPPNDSDPWVLADAEGAAVAEGEGGGVVLEGEVKQTTGETENVVNAGDGGEEPEKEKEEEEDLWKGGKGNAAGNATKGKKKKKKGGK